MNDSIWHNTKMINELINNKNIEIYLQAIVSIKDKKIFAYEALTRAYDRYGEAISPQYLFQQAEKENLSSKLDEYVRELALAKFCNYYNEDRELLLFLNFEASVINDNDEEYDFISVVYKYNISPSNIVVEIKEDKIKNSHVLKKFIDTYKKHDFLIAIDDFGTGYSSFDRLEFIHPDIVKVDRSIIYNIQNNFVNSEILNAIAKMCHSIGVMVLAEGVESSEEILSCMRKDIDIFQGFWFSKAEKEIEEENKMKIKESINYIGNKYKKVVQGIINNKQILLQNSQELTKQVLPILQTRGIEEIHRLSEIVSREEKLEAIYIIEINNGLQVGETIIDAEEKYLYNATINGHDHSLREYFFITKDSLRGDYLSCKYISKASGNMCRTYASKISLNEDIYIVCFDILN